MLWPAEPGAEVGRREVVRLEKDQEVRLNEKDSVIMRGCPAWTNWRENWYYF